MYDKNLEMIQQLVQDLTALFAFSVLAPWWPSQESDRTKICVMCGCLEKPVTWSKFKILSYLYQLKAYELWMKTQFSVLAPDGQAKNQIGQNFVWMPGNTSDMVNI
jgi:hypothetical protein